MSDKLYQARILDHYKHPRNHHALAGADVVRGGSNPSCGDQLTLYLSLEGTTVSDVAFEGTGCAISIAAASLLSEKAKGLERKAVQKITESDVYDLLGVEVSVGRKKCALLMWTTLQDALRER